MVHISKETKVLGQVGFMNSRSANEIIVILGWEKTEENLKEATGILDKAVDSGFLTSYSNGDTKFYLRK